MLQKLLNRIDQSTQTPNPISKRRSWIPSTLGLESDQLFNRRRSRTDLAVVLIPLPDESKYQNGIFVRKNMLVAKGNTLPSYLPLGNMPTAETKATEELMEAVASAHINLLSERPFRGPFTPQLGFDGGLDYQWPKPPPAITIRRFDVPRKTNSSPDLLSESEQSPTVDIRCNVSELRRRRQGVIFDVSGSPAWGKHLFNQRVATRRRMS